MELPVTAELVCPSSLVYTQAYRLELREADGDARITSRMCNTLVGRQVAHPQTA